MLGTVPPPVSLGRLGHPRIYISGALEAERLMTYRKSGRCSRASEGSNVGNLAGWKREQQIGQSDRTASWDTWLPARSPDGGADPEGIHRRSLERNTDVHSEGEERGRW